MQKKLKALKKSVLIISLKRFKYNSLLNTEFKINDYYKFPEELDLTNYSYDYIYNNKKYNIKYNLKVVLLHKGICENGHYYSLIKDNISKNWYKFDDKKVTLFNKLYIEDIAFGDNKTNKNL